MSRFWRLRDTARLKVRCVARLMVTRLKVGCVARLMVTRLKVG